MANNSDDFRRLMNLMESLQEPVLLEGWVDRLAGVFNGKSMGANERAKMAKELYGEWNKWLGKTDRVGDLEDLVRFMKIRVGFNDSDIELVFDRAGITVGGIAPTQEPQQEEPANSGDEPQVQKPNKKAEPEAEYDPEEGVPIPDDLDAKIMPYQNVGASKKNEPAAEPQVLRLTDRKFRKENGENDVVKIMKHLNTYPAGTKAIVGGFSYTSSGKGYHNKANRVNDSAEAMIPANHRSLFEAGDEHAQNIQMSDILDKKLVKQIMDYAAAQVNDEYLMNGPERDKDMAQNGYGNGSRGWGRNARPGYQRGVSNDSNSTDVSGSESSSPRGSGKYDAKVMKNILKTELEASDASQYGMAQKVQRVGQQYGYNGFGHMTQSDMELLAKIGYAFLRSK